MILERLRLIQILWALVRHNIIENGTADNTQEMSVAMWEES